MVFVYSVRVLNIAERLALRHADPFLVTGEDFLDGIPVLLRREGGDDGHDDQSHDHAERSGVDRRLQEGRK